MKLAIPVAAVVTVAGVLLLHLLSPAHVEAEPPVPEPPPYSWSEIRAIYQRERSLDQLENRNARFREELHTAVARHRAGTLTFEEAVDRLEAAAQQLQPSVLEVLEQQWPDRPFRERLAQMLANAGD